MVLAQYARQTNRTLLSFCRQRTFTQLLNKWQALLGFRHAGLTRSLLVFPSGLIRCFLVWCFLAARIAAFWSFLQVRLVFWSFLQVRPTVFCLSFRSDPQHFVYASGQGCIRIWSFLQVRLPFWTFLRDLLAAFWTFQTDESPTDLSNIGLVDTIGRRYSPLGSSMHELSVVWCISY